MKRLSVVLPFYYKVDEFEVALAHNKQYFTDDMELVIPIDEPDSELDVKRMLDDRKINCSYQVKSNPTYHNWRNPTKAINVGIRMAVGDYIIVMSPESICVTNVYKLLTDSVENGNNQFFGGRVIFWKGSTLPDPLESGFEQKPSFWYGSLCTTRKALHEVNGYNESFIKWGYDDIDIRERLRNAGYNLEFNHDAKVIHYEPKQTRPKNAKFHVSKDKQPQSIDNTVGDWGYDF